MIATANTDTGGESTVVSEGHTLGSEDTSDDTITVMDPNIMTAASVQREIERNQTARFFGGAEKPYCSAPPPAIDTTSLMDLEHNNPTSPMTPLTGKSQNTISPSGAFGNLRLNSPDQSSAFDDEDSFSLDEDENVSDKPSPFSRLDLTKRVVMNLSRSHVRDFYFNVFPPVIEMNNDYFCFGRIVLPTQYDKSCLTLLVKPCGRKIQILIKRPESTMSPGYVLCFPSQKDHLKNHALVSAINSHFKELKAHSEDQITGKITIQVPFEIDPQSSPELLGHRDDNGLTGHVTTVLQWDQKELLRRMKKGEKSDKDRAYTQKNIRTFIFVVKKRSDGFNMSKKVREVDTKKSAKKSSDGTTRKRVRAVPNSSTPTTSDSTTPMAI